MNAAISQCGVRRFARSAAAMTAIALAAMTSASAQPFTVFEGNAATEAAWRAAAAGPGGIPMETFEGFYGHVFPPDPQDPSDAIQSLPALGIEFQSDRPGIYPGVYIHPTQAHSGVKQLANFGAGMNQFENYRILPAAGRAIHALGFWQCDPQGDQPMQAYDAQGALLGTIVGRINNGSGNSFAGFVSTVPVARIEVTGSLGDGWNHIDDLQVVTDCVNGLLGDLNCDCAANLSDLSALLANFGTPAGATLAQGDIDGNGAVDLSDLSILLANFGTVCP